MSLPSLPFGILITSKQLISGLHINFLSWLLTGTQSAITALAGGGQAGAPALNSFSNEITVVANANDSVQLPPAKSGLRIMVLNSGANSLQVFGNQTTTDVIFPGNVAGNVGVALAAAAAAYFICSKDGRWNRFISS